MPFRELLTERLTLRRLSMDDASAILILRSDADVNKFIDRPACVDIEEAKKFISKINNGIDNSGSMYWVLSLKDVRTLIGTICLWNISSEKDMAEIGYELLPAWQGKGFMQEAITEVTSFGFREMNLKTITAFPRVENYKSIQLLVRNKFLPDSDHSFSCKDELTDLAAYYLRR